MATCTVLGTGDVLAMPQASAMRRTPRQVGNRMDRVALGSGYRFRVLIARWNRYIAPVVGLSAAMPSRAWLGASAGDRELDAM